MEEFDLAVAENKAIYEKIKDYVLEHMGLKVSSLYRTSKGVVWYDWGGRLQLTESEKF